MKNWEKQSFKSAFYLSLAVFAVLAMICMAILFKALSL